MLDDMNVLSQRDPAGALEVAATQFAQATFPAKIENPEHDGRQILQVVVAGMGGSPLAALQVKTWLGSELAVPFEVARTYTLPAYVGSNTLVITSSHSGNTEETLSCLKDAQNRGAQIAIVTSGGKLKTAADESAIAHVLIPADIQPRMTVLYGLRALITLLAHFGVTSHERFNEIAAASDWLREESAQWKKEVTVDKNLAK